MPLQTARGNVVGQAAIVAVVEEGQAFLDDLPRSNASDVIGYNYYRNLPKNWEDLQRAFNALQFRFADTFLTMNRTPYFFTMALTMCVTDEPINWLNPESFEKSMGASGKGVTYEQITQMLELVMDENSPVYISDMVEWTQGLKGDESSLVNLDDDFSWQIYTGMNYALACAVINEVYIDFVNVAKDTAADKPDTDDTMIRLAEKAKRDNELYRQQAAQLENQLLAFRRLLEDPANRSSGSAVARDDADTWVHHWVNTDNSHTMPDITRNECPERLPATSLKR